MQVNSYRVELENNIGVFCGCLHFKSLDKAENFLKNRKYVIDYENNALPNNKKYGTIWESELIIKYCMIESL